MFGGNSIKRMMMRRTIVMVMMKALTKAPYILNNLAAFTRRTRAIERK